MFECHIFVNILYMNLTNKNIYYYYLHYLYKFKVYKIFIIIEKFLTSYYYGYYCLASFLFWSSAEPTFNTVFPKAIYIFQFTYILKHKLEQVAKTESLTGTQSHRMCQSEIYFWFRVLELSFDVGLALLNVE